MKTRTKLFMMAISFASASAAQHSLAFEPVMMCTAEHPQTSMVFTGEGVKWVGASRAIKACEEYASSKGLDPKACRIVSCEPGN